jgi:hypothetical protein
MSRFSRIFGDCFDETRHSSEDPDIYDERNEVTDPSNPIWDGSDVHNNPYGTDPTIPDQNEINSD